MHGLAIRVQCVWMCLCLSMSIPSHPRPPKTKITYRMAQEYGLIAIPTSAFYAEAHQPTLSSSPPLDDADAAPVVRGEERERGERRPLVRFTFCKTDATLEAAAEVFRRLARDQRWAREGGGGEAGE